jgi:hypothetical protein
MTPLWDADALNHRRLARGKAHPVLGAHAGGGLIVEETGDPRTGAAHGLGRPAVSGQAGEPGPGGQRRGGGDQSLGRRESACPAIASTRILRPAGCPRSRTDPACHPKPQLGWQLIKEARARDIPLRLGRTRHSRPSCWPPRCPLSGDFSPPTAPGRSSTIPPIRAPFPRPKRRSVCHGRPGHARCASTAMARSSSVRAPNARWRPRSPGRGQRRAGRRDLPRAGRDPRTPPSPPHTRWAGRTPRCGPNAPR